MLISEQFNQEDNMEKCLTKEKATTTVPLRMLPSIPGRITRSLKDFEGFIIIIITLIFIIIIIIIILIKKITNSANSPTIRYYKLAYTGRS